MRHILRAISGALLLHLAAETLAAPTDTTTDDRTPATGATVRQRLEHRALTGEAKAQLLLGRLLAEGRGSLKDETAAAEWFRKAAMQGHAEAQLALGEAYLHGRGVPKTPAEATRWLRFAANAGLPAAARDLGMLCESHGNNFNEAALWHRQAAQRGDATSQFRLYSLLASGRVAAITPDEADTMLLSAANQGLREAQFACALTRFQKRDEASRTEGARRMLAAAEQGLVEAQYRYGLLLVSGIGVPASPTKAETWFAKATSAGNTRAALELGLLLAEHRTDTEAASRAASLLHGFALANEPRAQYALGELTLAGRGVPRDANAGLKLITVAAEGGNAQACYRLALAYETGEYGVPSDPKLHARWLARAMELKHPQALRHREWREFEALRSAALRGDPDSQYAYAKRLDRGDDLVEHDEPEAVRFYTSAADGGNRRAQAEMGRRFLRGLGVQRDIARALTHYAAAGKQGDSTAWFAMAQIHDEGKLVPKNDEEASRCLRRAAELGDARAQSWYGVRVWNGTGVRADWIDGYSWVLVSLDGGLSPDKNQAKDMRERLDPPTRTLAAERADDLRKLIRNNLESVSKNK